MTVGLICLVISLFSTIICALAMRLMFILQQEVRKYKSCGVFIPFVLIRTSMLFC